MSEREYRLFLNQAICEYELICELVMKLEQKSLSEQGLRDFKNFTYALWRMGKSIYSPVSNNLMIWSNVRMIALNTKVAEQRLVELLKHFPSVHSELKFPFGILNSSGNETQRIQV